MPTLKTQINSMHRGKVACWLWISLLYRNTLCINTRMRTLASQHISKLFLYEVSLPSSHLQSRWPETQFPKARSPLTKLKNLTCSLGGVLLFKLWVNKREDFLFLQCRWETPLLVASVSRCQVLSARVHITLCCAEHTYQK